MANMKKLKVLITYICFGVLSVVAEDSILTRQNDTFSHQCVQYDTLTMRKDSLFTASHISVDFNDITQQKWNWHYLIEILSVLAPLGVSIISCIWMYKTNKTTNQHQARQVQLEYQGRKEEKYYDACVNKQGEILSRLNEIVGDMCNGSVPELVKIQKTTNIIIASVPYLTDKMYEIASSIISITEQVANEMDVSTDNTTKLNQLIGDYISEYKENVSIKTNKNNNI